MLVFLAGLEPADSPRCKLGAFAAKLQKDIVLPDGIAPTSPC